MDGLLAESLSLVEISATLGGQVTFNAVAAAAACMDRMVKLWHAATAAECVTVRRPCPDPSCSAWLFGPCLRESMCCCDVLRMTQQPAKAQLLHLMQVHEGGESAAPQEEEPSSRVLPPPVLSKDFADKVLQLVLDNIHEGKEGRKLTTHQAAQTFSSLCNLIVAQNSSVRILSLIHI